MGGLQIMAIAITRHPHFDNFIMACIILNCVILAVATESGPPWAIPVETSLLWIFTLECVLKISALDIYDETESQAGYLNDPWNKLDFFVVLLGFASMLPGVSNFTGLRTLRVLRPLRTMGRLKDMKIIMEAVNASWPHLVAAYMMLGFLYVAALLLTPALPNSLSLLLLPPPLPGTASSQSLAWTCSKASWRGTVTSRLSTKTPARRRTSPCPTPSRSPSRSATAAGGTSAPRTTSV